MHFERDLQLAVERASQGSTVVDTRCGPIEVQQAGVFGLSGFPQADLQGVLATYCPHALYPYARSAVSDLVMAGGFPPFLLQPINFEQLYAEQMRRRAESAPAVANA